MFLRRQVALFPAGSMPCDDVDAVGVCLSQLRLERPRHWGACWLALQLWQQLDLDSFWQPQLHPSCEGTPWLKVLKTLVAYRLIDPGSQRRLDLELPTTDGRELTLSRYTQPDPEHRMLLEQLRLELPRQPPPKITAAQVARKAAEPALEWRPAGLWQVKSTA
jgi:hypothetical protein